jgi:hypothetical protein
MNQNERLKKIYSLAGQAESELLASLERLAKEAGLSVKEFYHKPGLSLYDVESYLGEIRMLSRPEENQSKKDLKSQVDELKAEFRSFESATQEE